MSWFGPLLSGSVLLLNTADTYTPSGGVTFGGSAPVAYVSNSTGPPRWGDGSKWGDGDKYYRLYGTAHYILSLEETPQRVAVEIAYSAGGAFYLDRLSLVIRLGPQYERQYQAYFHNSVGERVSAEVAYSGGGAFVIHNLRPIGRILRKHLPA